MIVRQQPVPQSEIVPEIIVEVANERVHLLSARWQWRKSSGEALLVGQDRHGSAHDMNPCGQRDKNDENDGARLPRIETGSEFCGPQPVSNFGSSRAAHRSKAEI